MAVLIQRARGGCWRLLARERRGSRQSWRRRCRNRHRLGRQRGHRRIEARAVSEREVLQAAEAWKPWRGYAAMQLWAALSKAEGRRQEAEGRS